MENARLRCSRCFEEFQADPAADPANPLEETCLDCLSQLPVEISFVPPYTCSEAYRFERIRQLPDELLLARFRDAYLGMLEPGSADGSKADADVSVETSNNLASAGNELGRRGFSIFQIKRMLERVQ
jgi:hypothetical protein